MYPGIKSSYSFCYRNLRSGSKSLGRRRGTQSCPMMIPCLLHACTALNHMGMHREETSKEDKKRPKKVNTAALEPASFCIISSLEVSPK